ncbi:AAA family ATPase [Sulfidibacter corallicola]|uniref:AAA family ATPase n=1 Tax=Sulfidibacter corallicola TaxID=2818388 RepID=A0A8A4TY73_SULCO|nr:AAA family ATPase [Sulfidibacter corallicola]QTD54168.1 AAA family ATPase [Sulfidibacter corallicola]
METIENIRAAWRGNQTNNEVMAYLSAYDLTHHQVATLISTYGHDVVGILKTNPYRIIEDVPGFGFKKADEIALKVGVAQDADCRIEAALRHKVREEKENAGHCYVDWEALIEKTEKDLALDANDSEERIDRCLTGLVEKGKLVQSSVHGRFVLSHPLIYQYETELRDMFHDAWKTNCHFEYEDIASIITEADTGEHQLLAGQRQAVEYALRHRIALMSGGAGSGKTFTIRKVKEIYEERRLAVTLCAPTGKAAKRMEQVTEMDASTIHRLLGYQGKQFRRLDRDPIDTDIIIVDEFSMVDVELAWALFQCIDLERTTVLLVGDHNQIEPVGPGNPLRDLIRSKAIPTVILDEVVRQAGELKENCMAILKGHVMPTPKGDGRKPWYSVENFKQVTMVQEFLVSLYEGRLERGLGLDPVKDAQILTPQRKGPLGTIALNKLIQSAVQKHHYGVIVPRVGEKQKPKFYRHDKVIQTRNNYDLGVMNGAVGTVLEVASNGVVTVVFEDQTVSIAGKDLINLELAYVLTVHKAQGSEYPCAIVVAHETHQFFNNQNLLYTAVTRARKTVMLVGDGWGAKGAAQKRNVNKRQTLLGTLLAGEPVDLKGTAHAS